MASALVLNNELLGVFIFTVGRLGDGTDAGTAFTLLWHTYKRNSRWVIRYIDSEKFQCQKHSLENVKYLFVYERWVM